MRKWTKVALWTVGIVSLAATAWAGHQTFEGYPVVHVTLDGRPLESDVPGINLNGRTMLPVRALAEALDLNVEWDGTTGTAILTRKVSVSAGATASWQPVKTWSGSGTKSTETFEMTGREWRISWKTANEQIAGILQVIVYSESGSLVSLAANAQGEKSDVSYVRATPGRFYLDINSANVDWEIIVEEQR